MTENLPVVPESTTGLPAAKTDLQPVSIDNIDSLEDAQVAPVDLMSDYWSPEVPGESKKVIFDRIENTPVLDQGTGEVLDLDCAYFFVKENGAVKRIRNGSKRLVGAIQSFGLASGAPLEIKYLGKKANKTNSHKSDNWRISPLIVNVTPKQ
jgi:hypothetical protein